MKEAGIPGEKRNTSLTTKRGVINNALAIASHSALHSLFIPALNLIYSVFMRTFSRSIAVLAASLLTSNLLAGGKDSGPTLISEEESLFSTSLSAAWDSRYVSEGRDNLDGDSLFGAVLETTFGGFITSAWIASSPDTDYEELNLFAGYEHDFGPITLSGGYTYLNFIPDDADDHEIGLSIAVNNLPLGITPTIDWYYSFESEGSFFEADLTADFEAADWLVLSPFATFGWNEGYIADGHNGANHVALGLSLAVPLGDVFEIGAYAAYNIAIASDPDEFGDDELLEDFFYGGVAVTASF